MMVRAKYFHLLVRHSFCFHVSCLHRYMFIFVVCVRACVLPDLWPLPCDWWIIKWHQREVYDWLQSTCRHRSNRVCQLTVWCLFVPLKKCFTCYLISVFFLLNFFFYRFSFILLFTLTSLFVSSSLVPHKASNKGFFIFIFSFFKMGN